MNDPSRFPALGIVLAAAGVFFALVLVDASAVDVLVQDLASFRQAVDQAKPGTRVLIQPGVYPGGFHYSG